MDVERSLAVLILLALRVVPGVWWIAVSLRSALFGLLLGLGAALALWPLAGRLAPPELALGLPLWAAAPVELARGVVLGLGGLLPLWVLAWAGRMSDAFRDASADAAAGGTLERLYAWAAIAVLFASGAYRFVVGAIAGSLVEVPLGSAVSDLETFQEVMRGLSFLIARAFELGVVLSAPVLLVCLSAVLLLGLSQRVSAPLGAALLRGPLLPAAGLSAACLSISGILGEYPQLARVFVDTTRALLFRLR
jgi:type III secretory pathway component EscT